MMKSIQVHLRIRTMENNLQIMNLLAHYVHHTLESFKLLYYEEHFYTWRHLKIQYNNY